MKITKMLLMYIGLVLLLLLVNSSGMWAGVRTAINDFDPSNPPEPSARFTVTVSAAHGYASGGGVYVQGGKATIRVSSYDENYTFAYWTKNGVKYSEAESFEYTVEENARFVAVYDFTPVDPSEPVMANEYRLYLKPDMEGACSFNRTSGAKVEADGYVELEVYPSPGFVFTGWIINGLRVSGNQRFNYYMPRENTTVTASFVYNPVNPDEPDSDGNQSGNIDTGGKKKGDVNGDGEVNTTDAVMLVNSYVGGEGGKISLSVADMNGDGEVNTTDAVMIINNYVNNE